MKTESAVPHQIDQHLGSTEAPAAGSGGSSAKAEDVFARAFRRLGLGRPVPHFCVEYRAFASLRSTIRLRDGHAQVRITDLLAAAPPLVLEALAEILLAQVFRRRPSREARECFSAYVTAPSMRQRIDEVRRERGTKRLLPPRGRYYSLEKIFVRLNQQFFQSGLVTPRLGWSRKRSRTLLGHYDAAHRTITISRKLDSPSVPRYLIEYLVFHEMLHMRFPVGRRGHRRLVHPPEFRQAEKSFPKYEEARRLLKLIC